VVDVNNDGLDDLILCYKNKPAEMYVQGATSWRRIRLPGRNAAVKNWASVRVGILNGRRSLVAVGAESENSRLLIFRSMSQAPYFYFPKPLYACRCPVATPDVEIIDVNGDGRNDLYVLQQTKTKGYCKSASEANTFLPASVDTSVVGRLMEIPDSFHPPKDRAQDVLLIATRRKNLPFRKLAVRCRFRGCGTLVQKLGARSLVRAGGAFYQWGDNYLLRWT